MISIIRRLHGFRRAMSTTPTIKIATHNGHFHCDEIFACFLLKNLPRYANAEIVRGYQIRTVSESLLVSDEHNVQDGGVQYASPAITQIATRMRLCYFSPPWILSRDPKILDECHTVVDVGGVFDAERRRFDHHQKTFTDTFQSLQPSRPYTTKLSSAGLIYVHYGKEIIQELLKNESIDDKTRDHLVEMLYDKLYEKFVQEIDAIDNGIDIGENMKYKIHTNLSARVGFFNPAWNDPNPAKTEETGFRQAMELIGKEFLDVFHFYIHQWWPARAVVEQAIAKRFDIDRSGSVLVLDRPLPWREHLFDIEQEQSANLGDTIKYVLYPDSNGTWRIQAVPLNNKSFDNRLSLPKEWQGLRDEELSTKSGIPGCVFVHASGFIGGNATYEGVLAMARRSLELDNSRKRKAEE